MSYLAMPQNCKLDNDTLEIKRQKYVVNRLFIAQKKINKSALEKNLDNIIYRSLQGYTLCFA